MACKRREIRKKGFIGEQEEDDDAEKIILQTEDGQNVKGYPCTPCIVGTWKDVYDSEKILRITQMQQVKEISCLH